MTEAVEREREKS